MKNGLDEQYIELLKDILDNGFEKDTRNGKTLSVFGRSIRYKFENGKFPLLTTKKMPFKTIVTELIWFLRGDTNIKYLVDNDCHIWDGDCYKAYLKEYNCINEDGTPLTQEEFVNKIKTNDEFAKKWGELGPIYGKQWRNWERRTTREEKIVNPGVYIEHIDQIQNLINELKTNPDSRRLMVNSWNVGDLRNMVLPPCHYGFQLYTRILSESERINYWCLKHGRDISYGKELTHSKMDFLKVPSRSISLMFSMRSNDVPLGLPFNISFYALLLEIISKMVNMVPDELMISLGDAHIYKNQIDGVKQQITRIPKNLPNLKISEDLNFKGTIDEFLDSWNKDSFRLDGYESHPQIKIPLSN